MRKRKKNKIIFLYISYVLMVLIIAALTFMNSATDKIGIVINVTILGIVFVVFKTSGKRMRDVQRITEDLQNASIKINSDFEIEKKYLWEKYLKENNTDLFGTDILQENFKKYLNERKRLVLLSEASYKCSIEDYINIELIDTTIKKNVLNLVPGAMTGLGILGTFVGLTLGLQSFNTGTSEEISASIAPLMDGIKVAFLTSIYGMVFSLLFNYVYKDVLEEAYIALDNFLLEFENHVDSNADSDNHSQIQSMLKRMPEEVGFKITEILKPSVDRMNDIMENFTKNIADTQIKGVAEIVDHFMESMNTSLGDSFKELEETIRQTCQMQRENGEMMTDILSETKRMTGNITAINELSIKTVEEMSAYVDKLEHMQVLVNDNFIKVNAQLEYQKDYNEKFKDYIDILVIYERQIGEASVQFSEDMAKQLEVLGTMENKISESTRENLEMLSVKAEEYNKSLNEAAKQELQGVLSMAEEYSLKVTEHLNTIDNMNETLTKETENKLQILSEQARENNKVIAAEAKEQMEMLLNLSEGHADDMEKAAEKLTVVSSELNDKLVVSLNNAFNAIDENLAEITQHLSGTIAEINETTERVPHVVKASYEGIKMTFEDMQKKYETVMSGLDKMAQELSQYDTSKHDSDRNRRLFNGSLSSKISK